MAINDYNKRIEVYHNRKYRRRRVRFYSLLVVVVTLLVTLTGLMYIKNLPIDLESVASKETVRQVMVDEYGVGYIGKLREVSELRYDTYYQGVRGEYLEELNGKARPKDLDKKGLEVAFFVEYVTGKANKKAESYGYQEYSRNYYQNYKNTIEEKGNEKYLFDKLIEEHHKEEASKEVLEEVLGIYDDLMDKGYVYLTSISISEDGE